METTWIILSVFTFICALFLVFMVYSKYKVFRIVLARSELYTEQARSLHRGWPSLYHHYGYQALRNAFDMVLDNYLKFIKDNTDTEYYELAKDLREILLVIRKEVKDETRMLLPDIPSVDEVVNGIVQKSIFEKPK